MAGSVGLSRDKYEEVARQLQEYVRARFEDAIVQIGEGLHYRGTNVVITSKAFAGQLPEQRYGLVLRTIPEAFFKKYLRGGVVWFELAPGESGKDYMRMPRSEDVAARSADVLARMKKSGVLKQLEQAVAQAKGALSAVRLDLARECMDAAGWSPDEVQEGSLVLIGRGSLCDADLPRVLCALADDE
ncbi:MAG: hypothetical protein HBSAPP02_08580 [Phycisphaerae bacterium]|nr:MAG: hypothetical protein HRU71_13425 [Planctomycetia bacterium]RIK71567.1 MAG: hypothetical protein DCC66_01120 [Planctomycetota bacterium]GJQ25826.1 MAG: hypothetical protein HBSAPP02_08580 [Phycisphaerae bacterium]